MFHSMGAGASMFGHFLFNPPGDCDVYCIQLPGRENRGAEAIYTELPSLLDDLERVILPGSTGRSPFTGIASAASSPSNWPGACAAMG